MSWSNEDIERQNDDDFLDEQDREAMLDAYYEDMSIEDHRPDPEP
jgi:hypothetical protein